MGREDEIRLIAYSIWEEEDCPNGRDWEHWFRAEVVWEVQNEKARVESVKKEPKQPAKQPTKSKASSEKPKRTSF